LRATTVRCQLGLLAYSDSVFDQGGGVHHKLLSITSYSCLSLGCVACHWHRHQVQGTSVLRLVRRTRAIEVKQLAQGCKQTWQFIIYGFWLVLLYIFVRFG
jgi:hypothetical protein